MPCYDSRSDEEAKQTRLRASNLTALLCGVARGESAASIALQRWYPAHKLLDEANTAYDSVVPSSTAYLEYRRIGGLRERAQYTCDAVLSEYVASQRK